MNSMKFILILSMVAINFIYAQQQPMLAIDPKDVYNQAFFVTRQCEAVLMEIDKYESSKNSIQNDGSRLDSSLPALKFLHLRIMKLSCKSIQASSTVAEPAFMTASGGNSNKDNQQ